MSESAVGALRIMSRIGIAAMGLAGLALSTSCGSQSPDPSQNGSDPSGDLTPQWTSDLTTRLVPSPRRNPEEPSSWVLEEWVWEYVGAGWALAVFSTVELGDTNPLWEGLFDPEGIQGLFLVAPDGTALRVGEVTNEGDGRILDWDPSTRQARLGFQGLSEDVWQGEVNLVTAEPTSGDFTEGAAPTDRVFDHQEKVPSMIGPTNRVDTRGRLWIGTSLFGSPNGSGALWYGPDGQWVASSVNEALLDYAIHRESTRSTPRIVWNENEAWFDLDNDRVVYLVETRSAELRAWREGISPGEYIKVSPQYLLLDHNLATDTFITTELDTPDLVIGCGLVDVDATTVIVHCPPDSGIHDEDSFYSVPIDGSEPAIKSAPRAWSGGPSSVFPAGPCVSDDDLPAYLSDANWFNVCLLVSP